MVNNLHTPTFIKVSKHGPAINQDNEVELNKHALKHYRAKIEDLAQRRHIQYPSLLKLCSQEIDRQISDIGELGCNECRKIIERLK